MLTKTEFSLPIMLQRSPTKPIWPVVILAIYTCVLLLGTHTPTEPIPIVFNMQDKLMHTLCYGGLSFLVFFAASRRGWFPASATSVLQCGLLVTLATSSFGAVDELTQYFVPGRIVDFRDWIANVTGCIAGSAAFGSLFLRK